MFVLKSKVKGQYLRYRTGNDWLGFRNDYTNNISDAKQFGTKYEIIEYLDAESFPMLERHYEILEVEIKLVEKRFKRYFKGNWTNKKGVLCFEGGE